MGSPESEDGHQLCEQQREVTFVNDFYLGKSPVTQAQYEAVTGTNPTDHERIGDAPIDSMSWESANEVTSKKILGLIGKDIGKSSSYFENSASARVNKRQVTIEGKSAKLKAES